MLSADGRFLALETHSLNLIEETRNRTDIGSSVLVKDRQTGALEWVSDPAHPAPGGPHPAIASARASAAVQASDTAKVYAVSPSMSADGRYVAFAEHTGTSASDKTTKLVVYDRTTHAYDVIDPGPGSIAGGQFDGTSTSSPPLVISGDGSTIVFKVDSDLISLDRATKERRSIASSLVHREHFQGCRTPPPNECTETVPLRNAAPEIMGRGISFDGRRVVVQACCYHVYRIDQGVAARVDPDPAPRPDPDGSNSFLPLPQVTVGLIDMSSDGRRVVFTQKLIDIADNDKFTITMYLRDLASGGLTTLTTGNETSNVTWSGPFALSADGQRVFHQMRAKTGAPLADHPTVRQLMVVRDASTGALVDDPSTGKKEIVTATVDGVALRCGIEDINTRLVTNGDGRMLAYTDRDYEDTYQVVPWDRNQLSDVYVVDRSVPIRGPIHIESTCTDFDIGPIIPDPHP
jgi:hypothetical protein